MFTVKCSVNMTKHKHLKLDQSKIDRAKKLLGAGARLITPGAEIFDQAGRTLQRLREAGREVRRASLVNDVLIALSARSIGATLLTADADYEAIGAIVDSKLESV